MKKIYTIIFLGISGAGKGTQANLVREFIEDNDNNPILHLETGKRFRELMSEEGLTQRNSKKINEEGKLQPEFLAIWNWSDQMVKGMNEDTHLIVDGTPRKEEEARMFHQAIDFYERKNVYVINLTLPEDDAKDRLEKRGRDDDNKEGDIEKRFEWFKDDTLPAIEYMKNNTGYKYIDIDGSRNIEEVKNDIINFIND